MPCPPASGDRGGLLLVRHGRPVQGRAGVDHVRLRLVSVRRRAAPLAGDGAADGYRRRRGAAQSRPFLRWCDVFCLGRAEEYIAAAVRAALAGEKLERPSIIYGVEFELGKTYYIDAGTGLYPHAVPLANGKTWRESAYGLSAQVHVLRLHLASSARRRIAERSRRGRRALGRLG